jgi:hypothetical protein
MMALDDKLELPATRRFHLPEDVQHLPPTVDADAPDGDRQVLALLAGPLDDLDPPVHRPRGGLLYRRHHQLRKVLVEILVNIALQFCNCMCLLFWQGFEINCAQSEVYLWLEHVPESMGVT